MRSPVRWRLHVAASVLVLVGVVSAFAGAASAGPARSGKANAGLTVLAASSLTNVFPQIDSANKYSFGGSDVLAAQIQQGAPADVFAAASPKYPEQLFQKGLVLKPVVFATNRLVLITPTSNPAGISERLRPVQVGSQGRRSATRRCRSAPTRGRS